MFGSSVQNILVVFRRILGNHRMPVGAILGKSLVCMLNISLKLLRLTDLGRGTLSPHEMRTTAVLKGDSLLTRLPSDDDGATL